MDFIGTSALENGISITKVLRLPTPWRLASSIILGPPKIGHTFRYETARHFFGYLIFTTPKVVGQLCLPELEVQGDMFKELCFFLIAGDWYRYMNWLQNYTNFLPKTAKVSTLKPPSSWWMLPLLAHHGLPVFEMIPSRKTLFGRVFSSQEIGDFMWPPVCRRETEGRKCELIEFIMSL